MWKGKGTRQTQIAGEGKLAARYAGLRYVDDRRPGISRQRRGKGLRLVASLKRKASRELRSKLHDLSSEEAAVLALLHHGLTRDSYVARAA